MLRAEFGEPMDQGLVANLTQRAGHFAFDDDRRSAACRVWNRDSSQKLPCVGMLGSFKHRTSWTDFDNLPRPHDRDPMGDAFDNCHVVGDEQERQTVLLLQIHQQIDDLRLYRNVQRRDAFIRDDQIWLDRKGARDADSLALSARKFMRIASRMLGHQAYLLQ